MKVGVIGAGLMGTAVTQRLVGAGFEVLAYDVDADRRAAIERVGATAEATASVVIARSRWRRGELVAHVKRLSFATRLLRRCARLAMT